MYWGGRRDKREYPDNSTTEIPVKKKESGNLKVELGWRESATKSYLTTDLRGIPREESRLSKQLSLSKLEAGERRKQPQTPTFQHTKR